MASHYGTPILLVRKNEIPPAVFAVMNELGLQTATIVGGTASVSEDVAKNVGHVEKRIAGVDRYETAVLVAQQLFTESKTVFLASGEQWPDALVVGPIASAEEAPVLLVKKENIVQSVQDFIDARQFTERVIFGGPNTIGEYDFSLNR